MHILCGTNRPDAVSRTVAKRIFNKMNALLQSSASLQAAGAAQYLDLADLKGDIFDPKSYGQKPQWFLDGFQKEILACKGLLIVTPEYNGSFPGVLKYFIDMLKFPESLVNLPVATVGVAAGQFGALRAIEQLEMILHYRQAHLFGTRVFIAGAGNVVTADGATGPHEERIDALVASFAQFVASYQQGRV